jgi:hypothetical protein
MNRETRDKFARRTQADLTRGNACWETPAAVFAALDAEHAFRVDLTADPARALVPTFFGPGSPIATDALAVKWWNYDGPGFSNPPYGRFIPQILAKAKHEATCGFTSVLLLPVRLNKGFHAHVLPHASRILFCDRRITLYENGLPRLNEKNWKKGKLTADSAMFDSFIVVFSPGAGLQQVGTFKVPPHVSKADLERAAAVRLTAVPIADGPLSDQPTDRRRAGGLNGR